MKVDAVDVIPVSVPYDRAEISSQVHRGGVTSVLVRVTADSGLVGWGESCVGADSESIRAAVHAMSPFVVGRDPWELERMRNELWHRGLWQFRAPTASFAWAGIDMALWDLIGKDAGLPLHKLLGGAVRDEVSYFAYLARGDDDDLTSQCREGLERGYDVFYLKVGIDAAADLRMIATVREALGPEPRLRIDANAAWTVPQALAFLDRAAQYDIDFCEQPVREHPLAAMREVRERSGVAIASNEGLWTTADVLDRIGARVSDVFCFGPYWVGSLTEFLRLTWVVSRSGAQTCKHTHGELGIAAAAANHAMLVAPSIVTGNQQTASHLVHDILVEDLPIARSPLWPRDEAPGLGIEIDDDKVHEAGERYRTDGQMMPYATPQRARASSSAIGSAQQWSGAEPRGMSPTPTIRAGEP